MSETLTQGFIQSDFEIYQGGDRKTCSISITSIRAEQRWKIYVSYTISELK